MKKGEASSPQSMHKAKTVWRYRMRYTKSSWLIIMLALSLVLSACNFGQEPEPTPDVGAIFTAAAETVVAQFSLELTQTAQAVPTITPIPTNTAPATFVVENPSAGTPSAPGTVPTATLGVGVQPTVVILTSPTPIAALATKAEQLCMDSAWVTDVTYPDYPEPPTIQDKQNIEKIWQIQNTGYCTWDDGFALVPVTGEAKGKWVIDEKKEFVDPGEIVEISIDIYTGTVGGEHGGCWKMQGDRGQLFGTFLCFNYIVR